jgi:hypothetical protein
MRILFDHNAPVPLIPFLVGHTVTTAKTAGWDRLANGDLLNAAETAGFELMLTADKKMRYQQNFKGRRIAMVVLGRAQWPMVQFHVEEIVAAVNAAVPSSYVEVAIPFRLTGKAVRNRD